MYPELKTVFTMSGDACPNPDATVIKNSERLLDYICDLNLNRPDKFVPTPSQGLYIHWNVEDWEFHMECVKNGSILYTFRKWGLEADSGSYPFDEFIPRLEKFLLMSMD